METYTYNSNGDLIVGDATDNNALKYTYNTNRDLSQMISNGNGIFNYSYDSRHNLLTSTNDGVTTANTYISNSNLTNTRITNSANAQHINSSISYTPDSNLVSSITDSRGYQTS
ncbi:MAG: hypothetical protein VB064_10280 [Oscillospiraceae bacterium]|nr:hypothetical protein [Oscillospiraceae bacterium]